LLTNPFNCVESFQLKTTTTQEVEQIMYYININPVNKKEMESENNISLNKPSRIVHLIGVSIKVGA
jgi:hypothetical protein